jgi:hypothetical protein
LNRHRSTPVFLQPSEPEVGLEWFKTARRLARTAGLEIPQPARPLPCISLPVFGSVAGTTASGGMAIPSLDLDAYLRRCGENQNATFWIQRQVPDEIGFAGDAAEQPIYDISDVICCHVHLSLASHGRTDCRGAFCYQRPHR